MECKEYHELCAQKWNGKITTIMNLENIPELSILYSQNKKPYKFSHLSSHALAQSTQSRNTYFNIEGIYDKYLTQKADRVKIVWKLEN